MSLVSYHLGNRNVSAFQTCFVFPISTYIARSEVILVPTGAWSAHDAAYDVDGTRGTVELSFHSKLSQPSLKEVADLLHSVYSLEYMNSIRVAVKSKTEVPDFFEDCEGLKATWEKICSSSLMCICFSHGE